MENVLGVSRRARDETRPLVCLDEFCKQLLGEISEALPPVVTRITNVTGSGFDNSASPYTCSLSGGLASASAAAASISAMDGDNGAWAVLAGNPAMTTTGIGLYVCEDQINDSEQAHTTAQVAYIVFE